MTEMTSHGLFTEAEYARLLDLAASKYTFTTFGRQPDRPHVIWHHDIDYSPQRALSLAKLEAERGLRCVYHILLVSRYYNVLEPEIGQILRQIVSLGHEIGLHFDMDVFGEVEQPDWKVIQNRIEFEKNILGNLLDTPIPSMSFHNHALNVQRMVDEEEICGMINMAAATIRRQYRYVSDSNGLWRYDRLEDILLGEPVSRLHVLTHPDWWTRRPLTPYQRFRRIVEGRARRNLDFYLAVLKRDGRYSSVAPLLGIPDEDPPSATPDSIEE